MIYYDKTLSKADTSVRQTTVEGGHLCKADTKFSPEGVSLREFIVDTNFWSVNSPMSIFDFQIMSAIIIFGAELHKAVWKYKDWGVFI